jgi:uncharacterized DUF497 family protein
MPAFPDEIQTLMNITGFIWIEEFEDKIVRKHGVTPEEAEQVFFSQPAFRFVERGNRVGEDVYAAFGRTDVGRYLSVFFVHKQTGEALIVSARPMTGRERRSYGRR